MKDITFEEIVNVIQIKLHPANWFTALFRPLFKYTVTKEPTKEFVMSEYDEMLKRKYKSNLMKCINMTYCAKIIKTKEAKKYYDELLDNLEREEFL